MFSNVSQSSSRINAPDESPGQYNKYQKPKKQMGGGDGFTAAKQGRRDRGNFGSGDPNFGGESSNFHKFDNEDRQLYYNMESSSSAAATNQTFKMPH